MAARKVSERADALLAVLPHLDVRSVLLVSRPYQQRRAFATCKKLWPEVEVLCASRPLPLDEYIASIGDTKLLSSGGGASGWGGEEGLGEDVEAFGE